MSFNTQKPGRLSYIIHTYWIGNLRLVQEQKNKIQRRQIDLLFIDENEPVKSWEYAVLVSNANYGLEQIGQIYRVHADCENGFVGIKNQWGWGGYSKQDIERCALSARAVALVYNWWSWYVRLANPKSRLAAKTSRPQLLSALGKLTSHARVNKIVLALTHEAAIRIKTMVANVRALHDGFFQSSVARLGQGNR